jgi:hypothetical protein
MSTIRVKPTRVRAVTRPAGPRWTVPMRRAAGASRAVVHRGQHGVGPAVIDRLRRRRLAGVTLAGVTLAGATLAGVTLAGVTLAECDGEASRLLELWRDAALVIVVDAVRAGTPGEPGRGGRRRPRRRGDRPAHTLGA